jgi:hypothetical protein
MIIYIIIYIIVYIIKYWDTNICNTSFAPPLGLPEITLISLSWLLLIPIDLRLPGDLLGLCVCCFAIAGFKGAIKLPAGLVDAGI